MNSDSIIKPKNLWQTNFYRDGHDKVGDTDVQIEQDKMGRILFARQFNLKILHSQRWEVLTIWEIYTKYLYTFLALTPVNVKLQDNKLLQHNP